MGPECLSGALLVLLILATSGDSTNNGIPIPNGNYSQIFY